MGWGAFWIVAGVYILMIVCAFVTRDASLACIAAFLAACQAFGLV